MFQKGGRASPRTLPAFWQYILYYKSLIEISCEWTFFSYKWQVEMCKPFTVLSETSDDAPRSEMASTFSWHVPIKERDFIFPRSANALAESHSVKQWNPTKTLRNLSFVHSVLLNLTNAFYSTVCMSIKGALLLFLSIWTQELLFQLISTMLS